MARRLPILTQPNHTQKIGVTDDPGEKSFSGMSVPGTACSENTERFGAGDRIRTGDINLGKVALYQLSYSR